MANPRVAIVPTNTPAFEMMQICQNKAFGLIPKAVEEYLYKLKLTQAQERVYRFHFNLGYMNKDFISRVSVEDVAAYIESTPSTVRRAYQKLKELGILQRFPERNPNDSREQWHSATIVTLPRSIAKEILATPDRRHALPSKTDNQMNDVGTSSANTALPKHFPQETLGGAIRSEPASVDHSDLPAANGGSFTDNHPIDADKALQARSTTKTDVSQAPVDAQPKTRYTLEDLVKFGQQEAARHLRRAESSPSNVRHRPQQPTKVSHLVMLKPSEQPPATAGVSREKPRELSPGDIGYLSERLGQISEVSNPSGLLQEVLFSLSEGVQQKVPVKRGIHAAIKMIKTQSWRTPYGFDHARLETSMRAPH